MKIIGLISHKAKQLETMVLKNWQDECEFLYDDINGLCDVYIRTGVPIIVKYYGGDITTVTFFSCGAETVSVDRFDYGYITIG